MRALTFEIRSRTAIDACLIGTLQEVHCLFQIGPFGHQHEIMGCCTTFRYLCGGLLQVTCAYIQKYYYNIKLLMIIERNIYYRRWIFTNTEWGNVEKNRMKN